MPNANTLTEYSVNELSAQDFEVDFIEQKQPVVIRDLVNHWPLVTQAKVSTTNAANYLIQFDSHKPSYTIVGSPAIKGRFFYSDDFTGTNFQSLNLAPTAVLEQLIKFALATSKEVHAMSMQAGEIKDCFPGLLNELSMPLLPDSIAPTIWINNPSRVAAHFDLNDNIACVASGSRTFTLFPPEQAPNLYLGPMLTSPGGVPTSLVDVKNPDLDAFPKYAIAAENSLTATLHAGDAIFIPSPWWHAVESHDTINILINYWWNQHVTSNLPTANNALMMSLLAIADMDAPQKKSWQSLFNHFVFNEQDGTIPHLPKQVDDITHNPSSKTKEACTEFLIEQLQSFKG